MTKKLQMGLVLLLVMGLTVYLLAGCGKNDTKAKYPEEAIEFIAPANPGGGWDTTARAVAKILEEQKLVSKAVPVVNKPGGSGAVGLAYLVGKKGSGYTIMVTSPPIIINGLSGKSQYTYKDTTPIARLITDYNVFVVKADSPYKTLGELLDTLKQKPSSIKIGGGSAPGGMDHIAFANVAKAAGVDIKQLSYVSFQGGGEAITSLLGGHLDVISTGVGETIAQLEAGTVRILGVTSENRLGGPMAHVPTVKEQGIDVTYQIWRGILGTPDMPPEAVKYLQNALAQMVKTQAWKDTLAKYQWNDAFDHENFGKFLDQENEVYKGILQELGLSK